MKIGPEQWRKTFRDLVKDGFDRCLIEEFIATLVEQTAIQTKDKEVGWECGGLIHKGDHLNFIGGCKQKVKFDEAYRCRDCTASFHRDCLQRHFSSDAHNKNNIVKFKL